MKKILLINTGGTFNKVYNELKGHLEVSTNNSAIEKILSVSFRDNVDVEIKGILYKDSLELDDEDRELLLKSMDDYEKILIVHGTDTIDITATFLAQYAKDKTIVLTGAMKPFSIEPIEATSNLSISLQFLQNCNEHDIFVGLHGLVEKHHKIKKNRQIGKFEVRNLNEV